MDGIILKEDPETIIKQDDDDQEFLVKVKVEENSDYDEELNEELEKIITDDEEFVVKVKVEDNSDEEFHEEQGEEFNSNVTGLKEELLSLHENEVEEGINQHPTQLQQHKCFKCQRVFEFITDLDKHLHECLLRKITNSKKSSLKNNSKTGTSMKSNQKPSTPGAGEIKKIYVCSECSHEYNYAHGLKEHWKMVHGGQNPKPYSCPICSKALSRSSVVKTHLLTHAQDHEKKFTCELATCPKRFTCAENLRRHVLHVHGQHSLPYKCEKCDARFSFKGRLETHNLVKHGNDDVRTTNSMARWDSFSACF